jgi:hypothetical protein
MPNARYVVTNPNQTLGERRADKLLHGCGNYRRANFSLNAPERRSGKHIYCRVCGTLKHHAEDLADDPDRLSSEFMLSLMYRDKKE